MFYVSSWPFIIVIIDLLKILRLFLLFNRILQVKTKFSHFMFCTLLWITQEEGYAMNHTSHKRKVKKENKVCDHCSAHCTVAKRILSICLQDTTNLWCIAMSLSKSANHGNTKMEQQISTQKLNQACLGTRECSNSEKAKIVRFKIHGWNPVGNENSCLKTNSSVSSASSAQLQSSKSFLKFTSDKIFHHCGQTKEYKKFVMSSVKTQLKWHMTYFWAWSILFIFCS